MENTDKLLGRLSSPYCLDVAADDSHGAFVVPEVTAAIAIMDEDGQKEIVEAVKRTRNFRSDSNLSAYGRVCAFIGPDAERAAEGVSELMAGFARYAGYTALMVDAHSVQDKTAISVTSHASGRLGADAGTLVDSVAGILRQIESPYQFQGPSAPAQLPG